MPGIARRELLAGAASAAALAGCTPKQPGPQRVAEVPFGWDRGEERWVETTCGQCPAGCGIRVRVREGRALAIEGNREHPVNRGGLGPKGQAGLQLLYHPDRITGPLQREGPRGSGRWKSITWDEAIEKLALELRGLRERRAPHELVVVDGEPRGTRAELWGRFLQAYGSPNHLAQGWMRYAARSLATAYTCGVSELPAFDWPRTRHVLCFGAGLFESWCQTIHLSRVASEFRRGTPGLRVKLVQVSSRFSSTAAKTDEWVPIEPGTHGALALGLAHVLVRDKLYDEDFVRGHTFGFEGWTDEQGRDRRGFRNLILDDYPPQKVQEITRVPVETIERMAHELSQFAPAIVLSADEAEEATNGLGTVMAIHALNALLGNLGRPGGMVLQRSVPWTPWETVEQDEIARTGCDFPRIDGVGTADCPLGSVDVQKLPDALLAGEPYPVGALVFSGANPVFSSSDANRWKEALQRVPFVVSCSSLPDETTLLADLVLPDSTYLERWEVVEAAPSDGHPLLTLRQPVLSALHDTLPTDEVILRLARSVGGPLTGAFPWQDQRAAIEDRLQEADLRRDLERKGVWRAPVEDELRFATPSGKFEFFSQAIASRLAATTRGDDACLPHWEPPRWAGDPDVYPLLLVPYRGIDYAEGGTRHLSLLRELPAAGRWSWRERVEIHPDHARALGIEDGESVWVESPAGRRRLCARISPGQRPGTVGLPLGNVAWPPSADEPWCSEGYGLLVGLTDPLAGIRALQGTRVRVFKEESV